MKVAIEALKKVAKELNESVNPDPPIPLDASEKKLIQEIEETVAILEKGDVLSEKTADVLAELEIDIPAGVKVQSKKSEKKAEPKEEKKAEKKPAAKKESSGPSLKEELKKLLEEKKYTPQEIKEKLFKKFPDKSPSTITTIMSDCKSEKWTPFGKVAQIDKNGIMRF